MRDNYRTLKWALLGITLILASTVFGVEKINSSDTLNRERSRIEINTIINPIILPFLGASNYSPTYSLQLKTRKTSFAFRIDLSYQKERSFFFDNRTVVGYFDGGISYLHRNIEVQNASASFGYERSKDKSWGRIYLGADLGFLYENTHVSANESDYYIANDSTDFRFNFNPESNLEINNFGGLVKPFVGVGINLGRHFGLNIEGRTDLRMMTYRSFQIMDNSEVLVGPREFRFRTLPFIDLRLSYTFGNGRK